MTQDREESPAGQPELPLPFPEFTGDMPLLPARMVNSVPGYPRRKAAASLKH